MLFLLMCGYVKYLILTYSALRYLITKYFVISFKDNAFIFEEFSHCCVFVRHEEFKFFLVQF